MMMVVNSGDPRRGAWWAVAVAAFESSSLSKLAQSLTGHPSAPVRISVLSRGAKTLHNHDVELNVVML